LAWPSTTEAKNRGVWAMLTFKESILFSQKHTSCTQMKPLCCREWTDGKGSEWIWRIEQWM
jgi:hypothetical protein